MNLYHVYACNDLSIFIYFTSVNYGMCCFVVYYSNTARTPYNIKYIIIMHTTYTSITLILRNLDQLTHLIVLVAVNINWISNVYVSAVGIAV